MPHLHVLAFSTCTSWHINFLSPSPLSLSLSPSPSPSQTTLQEISQQNSALLQDIANEKKQAQLRTKDLEKDIEVLRSENSHLSKALSLMEEERDNARHHRAETQRKLSSCETKLTEVHCLFSLSLYITSCRPDGVFYSNSLKRVILLELTVPIEDRVLKSHQLKTRRYEALIKECASNNWKATLLTIEVGCRGYACGSIKHVLMRLGLSHDMAKPNTTSM